MSDQVEPSTPRLVPSLIQDPADTDPDLMLVPREKLRLLIEHDQKCTAFANLCIERVQLLEAYKADADASIKVANEQVYICHENLQAEKSKKAIIIPAVALVLGFVVGFFVVK